MVQNKQIVLVKRPEGEVKDSDFERKEVETTIEEGEALVKVEHISFDPAQRGWMNSNPVYVPPMEINAVVRAGAVGTVVESKNEEFPVGTPVIGLFGWQEYAVITKEKNVKGQMPSPVTKLPPNVEKKVFLNGLGMVALTAYFGLLHSEVAGLKDSDEVVVVSGAAGAVGSIVGQIAKIKGKRVIGIAGGEEKVKIVKSLGFDECIDYKKEDVGKRLKELAPNGSDVYFDNVAGPTLDAALVNLKKKGRVAQCGAISGYNGQQDAAPKYYSLIIGKSLKVHGFIVYDFMNEFDGARKELKSWLDEGKFKTLEDVQEGFDNILPTFKRLFTGQNVGKQLLKL